MRVPFVVYQNTLFVRKIDHGFELVPSYDGELRGQLPDVSEIKRAIKDAPKFKGKKTRFTLIRWEAPGNRVFYEAMPGWGIVAGNVVNEDNDENLVLFLSQPEIEAVVFVDGEEIEYATRADFEARQNAEVSGVQPVQGTSGDTEDDVPGLSDGSDYDESATESFE